MDKGTSKKVLIIGGVVALIVFSLIFYKPKQPSEQSDESRLNNDIEYFVEEFNERVSGLKIDPSAIERSCHHGSCHDGVQAKTTLGSFELTLTAHSKFEVFAQSRTASDEDYKNLFKTIASVYSRALTSEQLDEYWRIAKTDASKITQFDEFELYLYDVGEDVEYLKVTGALPRKR